MASGRTGFVARSGAWWRQVGDPAARVLIGRIALALVVGAGGGVLFAHLALPLPWLLGAMATTTAISLGGLRPQVPAALRQPMIAVIGIMLGGSFTAERVAGALAWLPSLAALPLYVVAVGAVIFFYLDRWSGFDRTTAFFAATPGGMSEMIALSDVLGGDQRRVALVHATRLLFIVSTIPFLARAFGAAPVAQPSLAGGAPDPVELVLLAGIGALGYLLARRIHLPAASFVGPLLASTAAHLTGWIGTQPPYLLMALAQLVIGASVGARFGGTPLRLILRALLLGAGATVLMLLITLLFGGALHALFGQNLGLVLLAFVPGGFTEMSLIALAMGVDPAFVVTHHSLRVFLVVLIAVPMFAWLKRTGWLAGAGRHCGPLDPQGGGRQGT
jgi:membrane AbrB-like protein